MYFPWLQIDAKIRGPDFFAAKESNEKLTQKLKARVVCNGSEKKLIFSFSTLHFLLAHFCSFKFFMYDVSIFE